MQQTSQDSLGINDIICNIDLIERSFCICQPVSNVAINGVG